MKLVDAIDLFQRRTYDRLTPDVVKTTVEMINGDPKYNVLLNDTTPDDAITRLSESLRRMFGDKDGVTLNVCKQSMHVARFSEYNMEM